MEFFRRLAEILRCGEAVVLATVVETRGSTPRQTGAKMIVRRCGQIFGTIGGGAGEAKVIETAKIVLRNGEKLAIEIDLTTLQAEGICGGRMRVWLEKWQGAESLRLVNQILANLENGQSAILATPFNQQVCTRGLIMYLLQNIILDFFLVDPNQLHIIHIHYQYKICHAFNTIFIKLGDWEPPKIMCIFELTQSFSLT